jgi:hypothetical protein
MLHSLLLFWLLHLTVQMTCGAFKFAEFIYTDFVVVDVFLLLWIFFPVLITGANQFFMDLCAWIFLSAIYFQWTSSPEFLYVLVYNFFFKESYVFLWLQVFCLSFFIICLLPAHFLPTLSSYKTALFACF